MRRLIDNYRNLTAEHCGSGSMRNLLYHYCRLELPEGVVFGLGSGLDCLFFSAADETPPHMLFGRSITMEQDLGTALGLDYRELTEADDDQAWQKVRQQVIDGKPTMLSGDIFYLDYRQFKVHFPGHRFVLLGFDEESQQVYLADRTEAATQQCSMEALRLSRNPPVGLSTANLWGEFRSSRVGNSLPDACALALSKTVRRMLGTDQSQVDWIKLGARNEPTTVAGGLAGIALLAQQLPYWQSHADAAGYAGYLVNTITRFGTGGALFRNLYSEFMEWARVQRPDLVPVGCIELARRSAEHWDNLSASMQQLAGNSQSTAAWGMARQQLEGAHAVEIELFNRLGDCVL